MSKPSKRAWDMLIENPNRPADEVRIATGLKVEMIEQIRSDVLKRLRGQPGVLIMRPSYLPVQYEHCPYCGGIMNIWGHCMDCQFHDDPTEWWRDE